MIEHLRDALELLDRALAEQAWLVGLADDLRGVGAPGTRALGDGLAFPDLVKRALAEGEYRENHFAGILASSETIFARLGATSMPVPGSDQWDAVVREGATAAAVARGAREALQELEPRIARLRDPARVEVARRGLARMLSPALHGEAVRLVGAEHGIQAGLDRLRADARALLGLVDGFTRVVRLAEAVAGEPIAVPTITLPVDREVLARLATSENGPTVVMIEPVAAAGRESDG